ncbi:hypothetical protein GCM10023115_04820 [Pontixanthobacter gangjinensis]
MIARLKRDRSIKAAEERPRLAELLMRCTLSQIAGANHGVGTFSVNGIFKPAQGGMMLDPEMDITYMEQAKRGAHGYIAQILPVRMSQPETPFKPL